MNEHFQDQPDELEPLSKETAESYLLARQHQLLNEVAQYVDQLNSTDQTEAIEGLLAIAVEVGVESRLDKVTPKSPNQLAEEIKFKVDERIAELNS